MTDLSAEPFVLCPDEAFGVRVDVGTARTCKGRKRHPAAFGRSHGERRGGRNGKEDLDAAHGGLLDHLVGGAGAHDERAVPPALARAKAEELVERHVALDKLLGLRAREGWRDGALVVSSRASYEMVQKAAMCGVEILFAVSAPTALAVRTAERCGMTLAAFARAGGPNVYTHPERLVGAQDERLCA